jgi:hypothetical protein
VRGHRSSLAEGIAMKSPPVVRPQKERSKDSPGKDPARAGKSGEGATSAMEQLILQEKARASDPARAVRRSH